MRDDLIIGNSRNMTIAEHVNRPTNQREQRGRRQTERWYELVHCVPPARDSSHLPALVRESPIHRDPAERRLLRRRKATIDRRQKIYQFVRRGHLCRDAVTADDGNARQPIGRLAVMCEQGGECSMKFVVLRVALLDSIGPPFEHFSVARPSSPVFLSRR